MKEKTLIIVNGFPRAGKDTFMDHYGKLWQETGLNVVKHSTIDTCKRIAVDMGWNGEKTPEMRNMLSKLKDLYTKYFDGPLNEIKDIIQDKGVDMLFVAMREPEEIRRTVEWAGEKGIKCQTFLIRSDREERGHGTHSDKLVLEYPYSLYFGNHGTEEQFKAGIEDFFNYMIK